MNISQVSIVLSIIVLVIVALLVFIAAKSQKPKKLSPIASLAFGFILAGIIFGDDRLIGYSLLGIGVILSVVDIIRLERSK
jgi:hypothetical protein